MKSAEDFRKEFGTAEESFRHCVRQTLTELECKEVKPVKKKISVGLVLAAAIMLLTVGAVAAGQWGILNFMAQQGKTPNEEALITEFPQQMNRESDLLWIRAEEALCDGQSLYVALTVQPRKDSTLVIPYVEDIHAKGSMAVMDNVHYDQNLSVVEYAEANGYEHIVLLEMFEESIDVFIEAQYSQRIKDVSTGLEFASYEHTPDGMLWMILQYGCEMDEDIGYPDSLAQVLMLMLAKEYSAKNQWAHDEFANEQLYIMSDLPLYVSEDSRRSIPEDAHDIAGYRGAIEYFTFTPYKDGLAAVSFLMDMDKKADDTLWMSGPRYVLLDDAGNKLCEIEMDYSRDVFVSGSGNRLYHGTIPIEYMPEDKVTIRLENIRNYNIIYDEYTYTLK